MSKNKQFILGADKLLPAKQEKTENKQIMQNPVRLFQAAPCPALPDAPLFYLFGQEP